MERSSLAFAVLLAVMLPRPVRVLAGAALDQAGPRAAPRRGTVPGCRTCTRRQGVRGVLIFVSVAERHVEILADSGIEQRVPKETWQSIVDGLTHEIAAGRAIEGFIAAVESVGTHLATHFPPGSADRNELPDHLIVIEQDYFFF